MSDSVPQPTLPPETPAIQEKPKKERKPPTEKQLEARSKGLQAMIAKRKEIAETRSKKKEDIKVAKKAVEDKILKEDLAFASRNEVDSLRKELAELKTLYSTVKQEKTQVAKPERIVERVVERHVPTAVAQPTKLTGHALLDKLFFEK